MAKKRPRFSGFALGVLATIFALSLGLNWGLWSIIGYDQQEIEYLQAAIAMHAQEEPEASPQGAPGKCVPQGAGNWSCS